MTLDPVIAFGNSHLRLLEIRIQIYIWYVVAGEFARFMLPGHDAWFLSGMFCIAGKPFMAHLGHGKPEIERR